MQARTLLVGLVAAALLASPALADSLTSSSAPWHWRASGSAATPAGSVSPSVSVGGPSADLLLSVADDGGYWYIVFFDPAQKVYAWCQDGAGYLVTGDVAELESCSVDVADGAAAVEIVLASVPEAGARVVGTGTFPL